jgi:ankyrin repeat protein
MENIILDNNHDLLKAYIADGKFDVNELLPGGIHSLYLACRMGSDDCAAILIDAGTNVNTRDYFRWVPLHAACTHRNHKCVKLLLKAGADIEACADDDRTPLHIACFKNDRGAVRLLLEAGANLTAVDDKGVLPQDLTTDPGIKELISSYMGGRATKSASL